MLRAPNGRRSITEDSLGQQWSQRNVGFSGRLMVLNKMSWIIIGIVAL